MKSHAAVTHREMDPTSSQCPHSSLHRPSCTRTTHYEAKKDLVDQDITRSAYTTNALHAEAIAITTLRRKAHTDDECTQV